MLILFLKKDLHPDTLSVSEFDEDLLVEIFEQIYTAFKNENREMSGFILSMARVTDGMRKLLESNLPSKVRRRRRRHDKTDLTDVYRYIKKIYGKE